MIGVTWSVDVARNHANRDVRHHRRRAGEKAAFVFDGSLFRHRNRIRFGSICFRDKARRIIRWVEVKWQLFSAVLFVLLSLQLVC
uniref:Uncharacterized protein n=1 Tax=Arundo donax TaxID=35708 RepID=A0A0A9RWD5_ARUDO